MKAQFQLPRCGFVGMAAVLLGLATMADATQRTWSGSGADNFWTNPTNWVGGVAPSPGDDLLFPTNAPNLTVSNNFPSGTVFNSITILGVSDSLYGSNIVLHAGINASNNANITGIQNYFYIPLTLNSNQAITVDNANASLYVYGDINTAGNNLTFAGAGAAQVISIISGAGGLIKTGNGFATFYASNTFLGTVQILQGSLHVQAGHALGDTNGNTTVSSGANLFLANNVTVPEPIVLAGLLLSSADQILTGPLSLAAPDATIQVFQGVTLTVNAVVSGTGGLIKTSFGTLTLNSNNTYSGTTTVNGGTLLINGSQPSSPIILSLGTLANPNSLGGTGTVGTVTATGGGVPGEIVLTPGNNPGILNSSNVALNSATKYVVALNSPTPVTGYGQLNVKGTVALGNATLSPTLGYTPALGDSFVIIKNDGTDAIGGTFSGLPQGALITNGAAIFRVSYTGGDGNGVTLTTTLGAPPAVFTSIASLTNSFEKMTALGVSNLTYTIQAATNLNPIIQWSNIGTATANSNGVFSFTDTNTPQFPMRFYQILSP
jgi:autotransporter-associated beta strand protein